MESREVQGAAAAGRGLQVQQQMVMAPASSSYPSNSAFISPNHTANIPPSSTPRFSFNSLTSSPSHHQHYLQQHHQNQQQPKPLESYHQNQQQPKPLDSLNSVGFDGSSQFGYNTELSMKKKRGRPRKYAPDGNIALLQLAPTTPISTNSANHGDSDSVGLGSSNGGGVGVGVASEPPPKRNRGRPPGSGKRQINAMGGIGGLGFTPHVITVNTGEDVASKIISFSQQGPRAVCILSANGAVSNVTLHQPSMSGAIVKYEGQYEIISLSCSFLVSENNGSHSRAVGLSVSLAGSDGQVLGGAVAGMLQAASPVTVIVGSFVVDGKKQNLDIFKTGPSSTQPLNMLNFGAPGARGSPSPQGGSSESSDENGGNPLNQGSGFYNNSAPPSIHNNNIQMYPLWTGHTPQ